MIDSDWEKLIDHRPSEARLQAIARQMNAARAFNDQEEGWEFFDSLYWSANRLNPADQERLRSILRENHSESGQTSKEVPIGLECSERIDVVELQA